ncbi:FbpB family small basic protein [Bacillus sp. B15-48]|nr:FbpB family small basic protein [Bacillus sp. B15-48]
MRRKQILKMENLISNNKMEILSNEKELARIEMEIDEKHSQKLKALIKNS